VKTNRSILKAEAEHGDVFNQTPCGCHTLDARGRFIEVNGMELRWLRYAGKSGREKKLADIVAPASRAALKKAYAALRKNGRVQGLELEWVRRDGTP